MSWIVVRDFEAALKFYTKVVGLVVVEKYPEHNWAELEGVEGGARIGITQTNSQEAHQPGQNAVMTFGVENIDEAKAELLGKGAVCLGDVVVIPDHVKLQMVEDQDGNRFQLCELLHHSCPNC